MPTANEPILLLLQDFLHNRPATSAAEWDISALYQTAARQNLLPILAYENRRHKHIADTALCKQLDATLFATISGNLNRYVAFDALSVALSAQGIAHMPVKGYYLRNLYPVPELRTSGDIDILIHAEDRQKTHRLMLELGYQVEHDWEPTYSYRKGAEFYEVHTNLMDGNLDGRTDLQAYFSAAWEHAAPDDGLRFKPDPDFHLIYTICHLAKHLYHGGAGLRMYLDVALYIQHFDHTLDWDALLRAFNTLRLRQFFCTTMNACRVWFDVKTCCPLPEPDEATLHTLLSYTLASDLFGHSRDRSVVRLRNQRSKKTSKAGLIRRTIFPPANALAARYTFLERHPWLLPLAWIVRLFRNLRRLPKQCGALRRIADTQPEEVDAYDYFMNQLGL